MGKVPQGVQMYYVPMKVDGVRKERLSFRYKV